jgi:hypothetical protein
VRTVLKSAFTSCLLSLLCLLPSAAQRPVAAVVVRNPAPVVAEYTPRDSVVVVKRVGPVETDWGTGTVVASGAGKSKILTNAHVAVDDTLPLFVLRGDRKFPATYLAGSRVTHFRFADGGRGVRLDGPDLALLEVAAELPVAAVAAADPAPGTRVRLWGHGTGFDTTLAGAVLDSGRIAVPTLLTSLGTRSGDSGSGVFDADGKLVGVCWGGDGKKCYGVPASVVNRFLTEKAQPKAATPNRGCVNGNELCKCERPYPLNPNPGPCKCGPNCQLYCFPIPAGVSANPFFTPDNCSSCSP